MPSGADYYTGSGEAWMIDGGAFTTYNHVASPNSKVVDCMRHMGGATTIGTIPARSLHAGCVNVAFMDGSVRSLSESIALEVWRAIGTRSSGDSTGGEF
jgi:prepilin-type processing-associated H-X9-DG protein